jgi:hypothetical protein
MGPYPKRRQPRPTTVTRTRLPGERRVGVISNSPTRSPRHSLTLREPDVMIATLERARAVALLRCTARDRVCRAPGHRDRRPDADAARRLPRRLQPA